MHNSINEASISDMVETFYGKVRSDTLLGPIFTEAIGSDWALHLQKMKAFWASVLLASRTYKGNPMIAHLQLPRLTPLHFNRWLELWRETAGALCAPELAAVFLQRAQMIGDRLLFTISQHHESSTRLTIASAL